MKPILTIFGVFLFIAALVASLYGCYLAAGYLWNLYAELDAVIRLVLLSSLAVLLLASLIIAGSIKKAAQIKNKSQLIEAKLKLYPLVVQSYQQYMTSTGPTAQKIKTESLTKLNELETDLMLLASSSVIEIHRKLQAALDEYESESFALLVQQLIKSIRRDLGHASHYDESKLKFLLHASETGSPKYPEQGADA